MKTVFRRASAFSTISILALATAWTASAQIVDIGEIVITPSRTPQEASKVGSTVNTVSEEEIEQQALPLTVEYLDLLPGISVSPAGGLGSEAAVSVRGAPKRYVKTLFNGIDISDPTSTQVQTSYQYLLADNLSGIEVLKGSQSTLYGSDAIAGVISLSTLGEIEQGVSHILHGEGGSHGSARGSYGLRAANLDSRLALNLTGYRTDGISAAASGTERDGYENVTFDLAGEHRFNEVFSVFGSLLYIDAEGEYDDDRYVNFSDEIVEPSDNPFNVNTSEQLAGRAGFNVELMDGRFRNTVSMQALRIDRSIRSDHPLFGVYDADNRGLRVKYDYLGAFDATDWLVLQFGADYERQRSTVSDSYGRDTDDKSHISGVWTEAIADLTPDLSLTAGVRHNEHSNFGGYTTYRLSGSYQVLDTVRLHSSLGTGFRAPSLYELVGPGVGNPAVSPETSTSFDIGVENRWMDERLITDVTYFQADIDNLIEYFATGPFDGEYRNSDGTSRQRGVETSAIFKAADWLDLGAAYTYTHAEGADGARLQRLPRHAVALTAVARPAEKWTVSASARIAIDTTENIIIAPDYSTGPVSLDDYVLVNAKVAYKPTEASELYLRAENLLNQDYQTTRGFNAPPLSVFAGFRTTFGP
jgi:vitamin B12 transporter